MLSLQQEVDQLANANTSVAKTAEVPKLRTTRENLHLSRRDLAIRLNTEGGYAFRDAVKTQQIAYWERSGRVPREYLDDLRAVVASELADRRRRRERCGLC